MTPKLAIFYHARLSGGNPPVTPYARTIAAEQMDLLASDGLYDNANEIMVGLNQDDLDGLPELPGSSVRLHGSSAESELPTLCMLQQWLPGHQQWYVLYFHAKGARHGKDPLNIEWRRCMERACIKNWRRCIADLDRGCDSVGCHWLTPEQYPTLVKAPFWGGNFWFSKASFLLTLPRLPRQPKDYNDFFIAENWIGTGPVRPKVKDYHPYWPGLNECKGANR